jgi:hypothetical protein
MNVNIARMTPTILANPIGSKISTIDVMKSVVSTIANLSLTPIVNMPVKAA